MNKKNGQVEFEFSIQNLLFREEIWTLIRDLYSKMDIRAIYNFHLKQQYTSALSSVYLFSNQVGEIVDTFGIGKWSF